MVELVGAIPGVWGVFAEHREDTTSNSACEIKSWDGMTNAEAACISAERSFGLWTPVYHNHSEDGIPGTLFQVSSSFHFSNCASPVSTG